MSISHVVIYHVFLLSERCQKHRNTFTTDGISLGTSTSLNGSNSTKTILVQNSKAISSRWKELNRQIWVKCCCWYVVTIFRHFTILSCSLPLRLQDVTFGTWSHIYNFRYFHNACLHLKNGTRYLARSWTSSFNVFMMFVFLRSCGSCLGWYG